mmetsp:Transcript_47511/g.109991  ORF Transcript_47511/g.109991 Transcript_47511/m.109991 type:complete len:215 (-) Transcript_47511:192-836(-)
MGRLCPWVPQLWSHPLRPPPVQRHRSRCHCPPRLTLREAPRSALGRSSKASRGSLERGSTPCPLPPLLRQWTRALHSEGTCHRGPWSVGTVLLGMAWAPARGSSSSHPQAKEQAVSLRNGASCCAKPHVTPAAKRSHPRRTCPDWTAPVSRSPSKIESPLPVLGPVEHSQAGGPPLPSRGRSLAAQAHLQHWAAWPQAAVQWECSGCLQPARLH